MCRKPPTTVQQYILISWSPIEMIQDFFISLLGMLYSAAFSRSKRSLEN